MNSQTCNPDSCYIKYTIHRASHHIKYHIPVQRSLLAFHDPPTPLPIAHPPTLSGHRRTRPIDKGEDFWSSGKKHQNHSCYAAQEREQEKPGGSQKHLGDSCITCSRMTPKINVGEMKEMEPHFINLPICIHGDENRGKVKGETHDARSWNLDTSLEIIKYSISWFNAYSKNDTFAGEKSN